MSVVVDALVHLLAGIGIGVLLAVAETRVRPLLRRWWAHRPRRTPRAPRRYRRGAPDAPSWRAPTRGGYSAVPEAEAYRPTPLPPGPPPGVLAVEVRHAPPAVHDEECQVPACVELRAQYAADDTHALTVRCRTCGAPRGAACFDPTHPLHGMSHLSRYPDADRHADWSTGRLPSQKGPTR